jgi:hypothetical protein
VNTPEKLDSFLVTCGNKFSLSGASRSEASQVMAVIRHFSPLRSSRGASISPRVHRALQGRTKMASSAQRLPNPRSLAFAAAGFMIIHSHPSMAVFVMLSYVGYLLPSEGMGLVGQSLFPPIRSQGRTLQTGGILLHDAELVIAGKAEITNDSMSAVMDDLILFCVQARHDTRPKNTALLDFTLDEFR